MTQFIKVTRVDNGETLYFNAHYIFVIIPPFKNQPNTIIRNLDQTQGNYYRDYEIKETPEEILVQLK
jgi:hypothetical protein